MTRVGSRWFLVVAAAAVPLVALLPAAPGSFTRLHPLRFAVAAALLALVTLLALVKPAGSSYLARI
ncbi:MAG: hypothetical protein RBU30_25140, partial [Polyangia bacterium]|nr:hypothetical protein [Polyangia bacterium]